MKLLAKIIVNGIALWAAAFLVSGVTLSGGWINILVVAIVFGLINAFIKPIVQLFSLPFLILTLGLFTLIINGLMLSLTAFLTESLAVDGFWAAVFGAIVISIVSMVLNQLFTDEKEKNPQVLVGRKSK